MKKKTFSDETKQEIASAQNYFCKAGGCQRPIHSIHHRVWNTEYNNKLYPLFIQSVLNGVGLCDREHDNKSHLYKITDREAAMYESFLQGLKK